MATALLDERSFLASLEKLGFDLYSPDPTPQVVADPEVRPAEVIIAGPLDDPAFLTELEKVEINSGASQRPPAAPAAGTLLDLPEFMAELEKLDIPASIPVRRPTIEDWAQEKGGGFPGPSDSTRNATFRRAQSSPGSWTYVRLMCAGAGAAAVVFYDRVGLIIASL